MKVLLDLERCQGHNRCYAIAPEIFDVDDYGMPVLLDGGVVPDGLQDKAALAIANCPEFAIALSDSDAADG
jgi:ferredoxin